MPNLNLLWIKFNFHFEKLSVAIHIHVFRPSQDSSVWLGLTSREKLMSPECSKHQVLSFAIYIYIYIHIYIYIYICMSKIYMIYMSICISIASTHRRIYMSISLSILVERNLVSKPFTLKTPSRLLLIFLLF